MEFLSDQSDEPEFQETVSTVQLCCSHLRRTLDDILSIDMIGLGKLRLMVAPFRPAHVLNDVLSQVQLAINEKNLQARPLKHLSSEGNTEVERRQETPKRTLLESPMRSAPAKDRVPRTVPAAAAPD